MTGDGALLTRVFRRRKDQHASLEVNARPVSSEDAAALMKAQVRCCCQKKKVGRCKKILAIQWVYSRHILRAKVSFE